MAKKGGSGHLVRMTVPRYVHILEKKKIKWLLKPMPGRHQKFESITLGVLLRDTLAVARNGAEVKRLLNERNVLVDGKVVKDERQPVGLMDIVHLPKAGKAFRLTIEKGRLVPKEIDAKAAATKLCKVTGKRTVKGGKIAVTFHDGRNLLADNHLKVGDTVLLKVPEGKLEKALKLGKGSRCLVTHGTHAGEIAELEEVIERKGSMDPEGRLKSGDAGFTTLLRYLFVVGDNL